MRALIDMDARVILETRLKVLEDHLSAENEHKIDGIMRTFSPEAQLIFNGRPFVTREEIYKLHESFGFSEMGSFSRLKIEIANKFVTEDTVILEQNFSGVHTGEWMGIAATGKVFKLDICTIYQFDGKNKIRCERVYLDWSSLRKQLAR